MRTILGFFLGLLAVSFTSPASAQMFHSWSQRFGSTGGDYGNALAVDGSGNVVVTGQFSGTVNFGGGDLVSAGSFDIFVAKYNASGVYQWSQRFGSTGSDGGVGVAMDGSGNVAVTGYFAGTVNFGGTDLVSAGGNTDIFVVKYNASGVHQWSQRFGSTSSDGGAGVAMDGSGNVVVTGNFTGTVDFGGGNLVGVGGADIFVAKYNASGVHQWSQGFGSVGTQHGNAVAVDGSGNVFVTGYFTGTVNFGGVDLVSAGNNDIYVAKYSASGVHQWSQGFGNTANDAGNALATDGSGNVVVTGSFAGIVDFGGGAFLSAGLTDIFVVKYNASGVHQWTQSFGSTDGDDGYALAMDGSGNVAVTGSFFGIVNFGGTDLVSVGGNVDIYVAKYNASGVHQWSQRFGSTGFDAGYAVALDGSGNVVVNGVFDGTVNFGGVDLVSAGDRDIYVAKFGFGAAEPIITSVTDIGNDQGRLVKVRFARSGFDSQGSPVPIVQYIAFRQDDAAPSASVAKDSRAAFSGREVFADGWTQVGSVSAFEEPSYGIDVPTIGDSTLTAGQYYSVFFIRAATAAAGTFFDSPVDSGYSLDNLAPGVPASFAYNAVVLSWNESSAADFDYFSIYGSGTNSFGTATLIDYTTATNLNVSSAEYVYYFVTATDFSGNEGNPAVVNSLTGVGGTPKNYMLSISSYPNPFNPTTTVRYTLPARSHATIAVYDLRGAHVATLVDADVDAGAHTIEWNGRNDRGNPAGSGVYFARLTSSSGQRSYKMTLLK